MAPWATLFLTKMTMPFATPSTIPETALASHGAALDTLPGSNSSATMKRHATPTITLPRLVHKATSCSTTRAWPLEVAVVARFCFDSLKKVVRVELVDKKARLIVTKLKNHRSHVVRRRHTLEYDTHYVIEMQKCYTFRLMWSHLPDLSSSTQAAGAPKAESVRPAIPTTFLVSELEKMFRNGSDGTCDVDKACPPAGNLLGSGGQGAVHRVTDRRSGNVIAMKQFKLEDASKPEN